LGSFSGRRFGDGVLVIGQCHDRIGIRDSVALVESCWEQIDDNPDAWYWSDRFVEAQGSVSADVAAMD
jgi:hypothetical protein